uniref:EF-hand domain-containing protein n=1 Tax=Haptolina brevifila TaxID=156173 RepID=A0A7S2D7A0_9EUKA
MLAASVLCLSYTTTPVLQLNTLKKSPLLVESWYDAGTRLTSGAQQVDSEAVPYFCNDEGCWVGSAQPQVRLPDGRMFSGDFGVAPHSSVKSNVVKGAKRVATQGIFAPLVVGAKNVMGTKELNKLRADVISQHSKVISTFVDTSDSPFGQLVLSRMFEAADKDGNGTLDKQEVRDALHALGFTFIEDKQIDKIFERGDTDGNDVIDFEEFVAETPKTLRSSLIKLAKTNGHDLGFLA